MSSLFHLYTAFGLAVFFLGPVSPILCLLIAPHFTLNCRVRSFFATFLPVLGVGILFLVGGQVNSRERLILSTLGLLFLIKTAALFSLPLEELRSYSRSGRILYILFWPGVNPRPFEKRTDVKEDGALFVRGLVATILGSILLLGLGIALPYFSQSQLGLLGFVPLFLILHLGLIQILACLFRLAGWNVRPLCGSVFRSKSIGDFWSRQWNLAFVEMNKVLYVPIARKYLGGSASVFAVFVLSGILHEIGISYPAGSGWGGPLCYFIIQGVLVLVDRKFLASYSRSIRRTVLWLGILLPFPILFHEAFRAEFILPFYGYLHSTLTAQSFEWYVSTLLWIAAGGNFLALAAGVQLPFRLNWRVELARLSSFNRKIMWNYAIFIGLLIITFAIETAVFHEELVTGAGAATGMLALFGGFWAARICSDIFYFEHADWPKGVQFVIGHALLTSLFVFLVMVYLGTLFWHLTRAL